MYRSALMSILLLSSATSVLAKPPSADETAFRALYKQLVEINTTLSVGSCTSAAKAMAARLKTAGLADADLQILAPPERPNDGSLIARYAGSDTKAEPILLLAHLDVVEARREDWERDPFTLVEENGFFYARGASDDKAMAAVFTDSLIRYKAEGFTPRRGITLALTCGEETPDTFNSVEWLLQTRPDVLKAAFVVNEGAGGELNARDEPVALQVQAGEKVYQDFHLEITNPGGHSSRPVKDNAVVQLAGAIERIGAYQFPIRLNPITRAYFQRQAELSDSAVAQDMQAVLREPPDEPAAQRLWARNPAWNGTLRTTCTPTMIDGGHAPNALPQRAKANVNCRILPGEPVDAVKAKLVELIADEKIALSLAGKPGLASSPPLLSREILDPVRTVAERVWPGVAIVPTQSTGATDGRFLNAAGIPTYGISGMFHDAEGSRAHGLNERIRVKSLLDGRRFLYELVKIYAMQ